VSAQVVHDETTCPSQSEGAKNPST
jgi:hypothetical protein